MRHWIPLLMVLGCFALVACDRPDPAAPAINPEFAKNATQLPFKAEFSGTSTMAGMCAEGAGVVFLTTGSGRGTHVGAATLSMDVCTDMATMLPLAPVISILVAANGDTLLTVLTGGGPDPVTGDTESEWNIAGGTGRFVGAQGQFTNRGRHNPDFSWYARSDGWISLRQ
jgi:hypothetical protein